MNNRFGAALIIVAVCGALGPPRPVPAQGASTLPTALADVGFDQRPGAELPMGTRLRDATGSELALSDLIAERPVLLVPVYFRCPMLCSVVLDELARVTRILDLEPGSEYDVLAVSFDASEGPAEAAAMRRALTDRHPHLAAARGWHFLTGGEAEIAPLMTALGVRARWEADRDLWAHAGGVAVVTPDGRVSRTFLGLRYGARDLRLALVEAAERRIGSVVDQVILFCFEYDPTTGRYSALSLNLVRAGGVATVTALAAFLVTMWRRERASPNGGASAR